MVTTRIPSPENTSLLIAVFIALTASFIPSSRVKLSLYSESRIEYANSIPLPAVAYLSSVIPPTISTEYNFGFSSYPPTKNHARYGKYLAPFIILASSVANAFTLILFPD
ncbi:109aa long hypothetical protein [Pyrococcus horikoshii OT3]|uniref:Uncharacterized protein n=1 Tax=Pyrococcus horikoshii (strain ATCC 700860 / DSM 12428 / JCM 9974 / NBRC 100139 / OT-3) TaxID=70601 RepID=O50111_PYRHO|nr:109aa long hypothetical protein [Pyrococcus horikoshii OT3]